MWKVYVRVLDFCYFYYLYLVGIIESVVGKYGSVWYINLNFFLFVFVVWFCNKREVYFN